MVATAIDDNATDGNLDKYNIKFINVTYTSNRITLSLILSVLVLLKYNDIS